MAIAEFDVEDFDQARQAQQDEKLLVKFYTKTVRDETASAEQGRAVFKEREYIDIRIPGARGAGAARPATLRDRKRFPRHYEAFKQRVELPVEGTPLGEWPMITRAHAEELSFLGVKTVEQLAGMSDVNASQLMGGQTFKAKANAWLERAKKDVSLTQLEAELAKRDAQIKELSDKLAALSDTEAPVKTRRKRRTKEEIARDNEQLNTGERSAEQGVGGGGTDPGS